ncbi:MULTISPECIES: hypothetical protein [unclassified Rhodococcus (in: high G+C Gram-positive bacteria)]|uniref:hypothetical protein n=1 Tax=unclassified Rhodococcus (in: high G+C Gram-positive bacteria) TaxID=192944 RepID=UPI003396890D
MSDETFEYRSGGRWLKRMVGRVDRRLHLDVMCRHAVCEEAEVDDVVVLPMRVHHNRFDNQRGLWN